MTIATVPPNLPRISVITPSFNQGVFLERALRSVLTQDYPQLEYIVIDGGSNDDSVENLHRYADQLAYWHSTPDLGQAAAINEGFARSSGEIMTWLNSDDVLLSETLWVVGTLFATYPQIAWITGLGMNIDANDQVTKLALPSGKFRGLSARGWYHGRLLGFIRQEGTFWRRELWQAAGALNEDLPYSMDYDLWRRFARHADLVTVQQPLAAFRKHAAQKTAALAPYYAEIGVHLPHAFRAVTLPIRALLNPLTAVLAPHVSYNRAQQRWVLHAGFTFKPGIRRPD